MTQKGYTTPILSDDQKFSGMYLDQNETVDDKIISSPNRIHAVKQDIQLNSLMNESDQIEPLRNQNIIDLEAISLPKEAYTYHSFSNEKQYTDTETSTTPCPTDPHLELDRFQFQSTSGTFTDSLIWVKHSELGFSPGQITGKTESGDYITVLESGETSIVPITEATPVHPSCLHGISDLLALGEFDMGPLLHNVRVRYYKNQIYTAIGPFILISVNPYTTIPKLYSSDTANIFRNAARIHAGRDSNDELSKSDDTPHVFRIAQTALSNLFSEGTDQSIIISGESGAGKTEATKIILAYLSTCGTGQNDLLNCTQPDLQQAQLRLAGLDVAITQSNPILESFGNAKTIRNDNSSRFGKFTQLFFTLDSQELIGARISNYLLEKSRIVTQQEYERNYHVFYQLCAGRDLLDPILLERLVLDDPHQFAYLCNHTEVRGRNDREDFAELLACLDGLKFSIQEQTDIFTLLAGILHIGNMGLDIMEEECGTECTIPEKDLYSFQLCCQLFGISESQLQSLLFNRTIQDFSTHSKIILARTVKDIRYARDALCKAIFERLFQWVLQKINQALIVTFECHENQSSLENKKLLYSRQLDIIPVVNHTQTHQRRPLSQCIQGSIGLLDIFGFEIFETNSFEQLCINFANEQLQQHFNLHVLREEQSLYQGEDIDWHCIKFEDNQKILEALTHTMFGIFPTLDSECLMPGATDSTFLQKVIHLSSTTDVIVKPPSIKQNELFGINHYAGVVFYEVFGMMDKNRDRVHNDVFECFETTGLPLLKELFSERYPQSDIITDPTNHSSYSGSRMITRHGLGNTTSVTASERSNIHLNKINKQKHIKPNRFGFANSTASCTFRHQLNGLMKVLGMTSASYIRCIKPNSHKLPLMFDSLDILRQLTCAGMLESIRIRKAGYPIRLETRLFLSRYRVLLTSVERDAILPHTVHSIGKQIAEALLIRMRPYQHTVQDTHDITETNQLHLNLWQVGKTMVFLKEIMQSYLEQQSISAWNFYATKITAAWKGYILRQQYSTIKEVVICLQSFCRVPITQTHFHLHIHQRDHAARIIQLWWKHYRHHEKEQSQEIHNLTLQNQHHHHLQTSYLKSYSLNHNPSILPINNVLYHTDQKQLIHNNSSSQFHDKEDTLTTNSWVLQDSECQQENDIITSSMPKSFDIYQNSTELNIESHDKDALLLNQTHSHTLITQLLNQIQTGMKRINTLQQQILSFEEDMDNKKKELSHQAIIMNELTAKELHLQKSLKQQEQHYDIELHRLNQTLQLHIEMRKDLEESFMCLSETLEVQRHEMCKIEHNNELLKNQLKTLKTDFDTQLQLKIQQYTQHFQEDKQKQLDQQEAYYLKLLDEYKTAQITDQHHYLKHQYQYNTKHIKQDQTDPLYQSRYIQHTQQLNEHIIHLKGIISSQKQDIQSLHCHLDTLNTPDISQLNQMLPCHPIHRGDPFLHQKTHELKNNHVSTITQGITYSEEHNQDHHIEKSDQRYTDQLEENQQLRQTISELKLQMKESEFTDQLKMADQCDTTLDQCRSITNDLLQMIDKTYDMTHQSNEFGIIWKQIIQCVTMLNQKLVGQSHNEVSHDIYNTQLCHTVQSKDVSYKHPKKYSSIPDNNDDSSYHSSFHYHMLNNHNSHHESINNVSCEKNKPEYCYQHPVLQVSNEKIAHSKTPRYSLLNEQKQSPAILVNGRPPPYQQQTENVYSYTPRSSSHGTSQHHSHHLLTERLLRKKESCLHTTSVSQLKKHQNDICLTSGQRQRYNGAKEGM